MGCHQHLLQKEKWKIGEVITIEGDVTFTSQGDYKVFGGENMTLFVGDGPLNKDGKPHNPLINSGAIMTTSLIKNKSVLAERFEYIESVWSKLAGGIYKIGFSNPVYLSEKATADRNYALA